MSNPPAWRELWNFEDPAGTEQKFRDLLQQTKDKADRDYTLIVETQLARTLGMQRNYDGAHALLDAIEPRLPAGASEPRVRYMLERGRTYNSSGMKLEALALFKDAWKIAGDIGLDALAMDAAHMVAISAEPDEALEWAHKSIAMAEASDDQQVRGWLGPLYNNTGWTYEERGDYEKAMELFRKGYDFRLTRDGWDRGTVIALWTIAHTYRKQESYERALTTLTEVERRWREIGEEPSGYTWEEFGETLLAMGRADDARPHFNKAYRMLSEDLWLVENEPDRIARLKQFSGSACAPSAKPGQ